MAETVDVVALLDSIPRPVKSYHSKPYDRISPSKTTFDAKGKTVLITAGATGVGLSISKAFAEAGVDRIIIVSRRPEPQEKAKKELESTYPKTKIETVQASVTDSEQMKRILEKAGGIDVLILCAAAAHPFRSATDIPISQIKETFDTNVIAGCELVQTYLRLPPPPSGIRTVLNISSASSHFQMPGQIGYGPSKAAINQVMSFFALEFTPAKDGVRIFSFHPGAFRTEAATKYGVPEFEESEDIRLPGHFSVWLASPEADFLHGRFVWAHWDVDELIAIKEEIESNPMMLNIGLVQ